jgi:hypothetical protein
MDIITIFSPVGVSSCFKAPAQALEKQPAKSQNEQLMDLSELSS